MKGTGIIILHYAEQRCRGEIMEFEALRELIVNLISCSDEDVTETASLKDDLGMDSLDAMELVMLIEEKTGISIPEEKLPDFVTVSDILNYLQEAKEN